MDNLLKDKRQIRAIFFIDGTLGWTIEPVRDQIPALHADKIEVYPEFGSEHYVPWFAIWRDNKIIERVNAQAVSEVMYAADDAKEKEV